MLKYTTNIAGIKLIDGKVNIDTTKKNAATPNAETCFLKDV